MEKGDGNTAEAALDPQEKGTGVEPKTNPETNPEAGAEINNDEKVYPPMSKVMPAMLAIYLVFFLVALDRTILGTAIPTISRQFNSFGDIFWYESGFLLPICAFQLSFGLIYRYYSTKWVLLVLTALFEIGSIISAAAPTSNAFIIGRVISGIGGVGIGPGAFLLITLLVPLHKRPMFMGSMGAMFGISSILGPILGGYLTSVSWRWCFWINVPVGGVSMVLLILLAPNAPPPSKPASSWYQRLLDLDPLGCLLIAPSIICLLFALQFGGKDQSWSQPRAIALFVLFGAFLLVFIFFQVWRKEKATVPPRIICERNILSGCIIGFSVGSALVLYSFYLPIWFQVVQGRSPQNSGLALIPLLLSNVAAIVLSGFLVTKVGYYTPFSIVGGIILVTGSALITTWTPEISEGKWIGYQILTGFGLGLCLQQPNIAVQRVLSDKDIPIGTSILNFFVFLGGTIFVAVSQTLLESQLIKRLTRIVPDLDPASLAGSGATSLQHLVPHDKLGEALKAYNDSMKSIWYLALGLCAVTFIGAFGLEWKSVKAEKKINEEAPENGK
ncbi:major facilitator superfamily domain-containing protein [Mariannaea sp. PMI_226]|nr:major facilitator superfamily domain-containing protein [Mariannaea sp. PMI_226]